MPRRDHPSSSVLDRFVRAPCCRRGGSSRCSEQSPMGCPVGGNPSLCDEFPRGRPADSPIRTLIRVRKRVKSGWVVARSVGVYGALLLAGRISIHASIESRLASWMVVVAASRRGDGPVIVAHRALAFERGLSRLILSRLQWWQRLEAKYVVVHGIAWGTERRNEPEEGRDDGWVEMRSAPSRDLFEHFLRRPWLLVGARGTERVVDIADRADSSLERDFFALEAIRISSTVPALVVGSAIASAI